MSAWRDGFDGLPGIRACRSFTGYLHKARRDLGGTRCSRKETRGTFALRSPVRPNPIASSLVELVAVDGASLQVRGLDCLDGTPPIDLKPEHGAHG